MAKKAITINSVNAISKYNNMMAISYNYGQKQHKINADCSRQSIYQAVENDVKSNGYVIGYDCTRSYKEYNGE